MSPFLWPGRMARAKPESRPQSPEVWVAARPGVPGTRYTPRRGFVPSWLEKRGRSLATVGHVPPLLSSEKETMYASHSTVGRPV